MNFTDQTTLGVTLARRIEKFRGKDAVIVCLRESSLMTCLAMATQLRAWVFPLIYAPVYTTGHAHTLLGAFDQDGKFCALHDGPLDEYKMSDETNKVIEGEKTEAMKSIHAQAASYGMKLDKHQLDGRAVIFAADILTNQLPLLVAQQYLKDIRPKSRTAIAGNATPEAAQLLRISASESEVLDILIGPIFDDNHYYEHTDNHADKQKFTLTQHIAAYWQ